MALTKVQPEMMQQLTPAIMPTGSVIQTVSAVSTSLVTTTSGYPTFVTTGMTVSITPQFSNSKILVLTSIPAYCTTSANSNLLTLYRNSTNLAPTGQLCFVQIYGTGSANYSPATIMYLDSPATTSSTTYTVYFCSGNAGTSVGVFQNYEYGTITVQEIKA